MRGLQTRTACPSFWLIDVSLYKSDTTNFRIHLFLCKNRCLTRAVYRFFILFVCKTKSNSVRVLFSSRGTPNRPPSAGALRSPDFHRLGGNSSELTGLSVSQKQIGPRVLPLFLRMMS